MMLRSRANARPSMGRGSSLGGMGTVLAALVGALLVGVAMADTIPPIFTGGFPTIPATSNLGTQFTLTTNMNEAGTTYYIVVAANSVTPTAAQVVAGATYSSVSIVKAGTISVSAASTDYSASVTGLTEQTEYDIYVVAKDSAGNLQTTPTLLIILMADVTPPVYNTNYPKLVNIQGDKFDIEVSMDEVGVAYYVLVENGAAAPTSAEVMASEASGGGDPLACGYFKITAANTVFSTTVTTVEEDDPNCKDTVNEFYGLVAEGVSGLEAKCKRCPLFKNFTDYDVYVVAEDDESEAAYYRTNNVQTSPTLVNLLTADDTSPSYVDGYPKIVSLQPFSFYVAIQLQEVGYGYFMVVPAGSGYPTSDEIKALSSTYTNSAGATVTVVANGTLDLPTPYTEVTAVVSGLTDETLYEVYVVVQDDGNNDTTLNVYSSTAANLQVTPNLIEVTTRDGTPPTFITASEFNNPTTAAVAGINFDLVAQLDEIGRVYYVVVPAGSVPPSTADIRGGQGNPMYSNSSAVACGSWGIDAAASNYSTTVQGVESPDRDPRCVSDFYGLTTLGIDAGSQFCAVCPIIASETTYDIYLVAEDDSGNLQIIYTLLSVTTTDITPPKFQAGTPAITYNLPSEYTYLPNEGGVSLGLTVQLDEPGRAYYLVVPTGSAEPNSHTIKAMVSSYNGVNVTQAGYFNITSAHVSVTHEIKSLSSEVTYDIWVVAEDDENLSPIRPGQSAPSANLQEDPEMITQLTADITPPTFTSGFPNVFNNQTGAITGTTFELTVRMDEPGTLFYVVVPSGYTFNEGLTDGTARSLPTPDEVKAGTGPGGTGQVTSGSITVGSPSSTYSWNGTVSGLASQTQYDVYMVAQDDAHAGDLGPNLQIAVIKIDITTRDVTPPTFISGYPKSVVGGVAVDIVVQLNEVGKFYYIVVASGSTAPTVAEVVAGVTYSSVTVHAACQGDATGTYGKTVSFASTDTICTTTGIPTESSLVAYIVAEDNVDQSLVGGQADSAANLQTSVSSVSFTTRDVTSPTFVSDTPRVENLTGTYFNVHIALDEIGIGYYSLVLRSDPAPSAPEVKMGTGKGGTFAQTSDTVDVLAANTEYSQLIPNNLTSETDYMLYVTAQDDETSPNLQQTLSTIRVRTPDVTAPTFVGHWTINGTVTNVGGHDFDIVSQLDEVGTVYFIVVPMGSPAPTSEEVRSSRAAYDLEPNACGYISVNQAYENRTGSVLGVDIGERPDCQVHDGFYGLPGKDSKFYGYTVDGEEPYCSRCPMIDSETAYDVWIVAEDDGGHGLPEDAVAVDVKNMQEFPTKVMIINYPEDGPSVFTADITHPEYQLSTPKADNLKGTALDVVVALDEPGTAYFVLVKGTASAASVTPTRAQVLNCTDGNSTAAAACGNITVYQSSTLYPGTVSGLEVDTVYKVYVYAEDDEPNDSITPGPYRGMTKFTAPNRGPVTPVSTEVTTVDTYAPQWTSGYPVANNALATTTTTVSTTFDVVGNLDEPGTVYYVAFEPAAAGSGLPGSQSPTSANVKACQDYLGATAAICGSVAVSAATTDATVTTTYNLTDNTLYDVYIVAEDTELNIQGFPEKVSITTADGSAPLFTAGYPFISTITSSSTTMASSTFTVTLEVNTNEAGSVHYAVILSSSVQPTKSQVAALGSTYTASDGTVVTPLATGSVTVSAASTTYTASISVASASFSTSVGFQVYVVTEDSSSNVGDGDTARTALTRARSLSPGLISPTPQTSSLLETTFYLDFQTHDQATIYYVVLKNGATAPSALHVKSGWDAFGNASPNGEFADTSSSTSKGSLSIASASTNFFSNTTISTQILNVTRGTIYDVYVVTDDASLTISTQVNSSTPTWNETSRQVTKLTVTTPDTSAPLFKAGFPNFKDATGTSFNLALQIDEPGKAYYVCLPYGSFSPTVAEVKSGSGGSDGASPVVTGTLDMATAVNPSVLYDYYLIPVTGMSPATIYECYVVAEDLITSTGVTSVNVQADPTRVTVRTPSVDSTLSGITLSDSTLLLQPPFHPDHQSYSVFVADGTSTISFGGTAAVATQSTITINGTVVTSGSAGTQALTYGTNTFEMIITAGDGVTKKTYYVNAIRGAAAATANATLAILSLKPNVGSEINSTAMGGRGWPTCTRGCTVESAATCNTINPECMLDSSTTAYTAFVSTDVSYVDVHAVATESSLSTIKIFTPGQAGTDYPGGLPGYTSGTLLSTNPRVAMQSLFNNSGANMRIHVVVTAGDAISTSTYTIDVFRHGPGTYESWAPVIPTTAQLGPRYNEYYATNDLLTTYVTSSPTVTPLTIIPPIDITPPTFLSSYPALMATTSPTSSVTVRVQLDEPGTVYWVVVPGGTSPGPNSREVKTSSLRSDIVVYGSITAPDSPSRDVTREAQIAVQGLTTNTTYDIYLVAEDDYKTLSLTSAPNLQTTPTVLSHTTS